MTIYVDILVITNLYIDFFLLWCVRRVLRITVRNRRLVLGALTGALCSLTVFLPESPPALSLVISLLSAAAAAAAAFLPLTLRTFLRAVFCLWAFTLGLAGFFLFLIRFFAPQRVAVIGSVVYFDLSLPLLFLFTCAAYLVFSLAGRLLPGAVTKGGFCTLIVENRGVSVRLLAKADTGNSLREPFSGLPVILCRAESLKDAAPPEILIYPQTGAEDSLPAGGIRLIPFDSIGGRGLLPAFRPDTVKSAKSGTALNCWVAVCRQSFAPGQFDALFDPNRFPEL